MSPALEAVEPAAIRRWPLPHQSHSPVNRILIRLVYRIFQGQLRSIEGLEQIAATRDPFILVANHGSRREALLLPALLFLARGGRPVHFLADWNFRLIPGVDLLYRAGGAITVTRKSARPRFLNRLKPLFEHPQPPLEQARQRLLAGHSVGIFPEGTVNRRPEALLTGRGGAARLSLETGAPIIPLGLRFAGIDAEGRTDSASALTLHFHPPLQPPTIDAATTGYRQVRNWHARIMLALADASKKRWPP